MRRSNRRRSNRRGYADKREMIRRKVCERKRRRMMIGSRNEDEKANKRVGIREEEEEGVGDKEQGVE